jgi:hypothetical protein
MGTRHQVNMPSTISEGHMVLRQPASGSEYGGKYQGLSVAANVSGYGCGCAVAEGIGEGG